MTKIDLNCDIGESFGAWNMGDDVGVMPWITSANIACGFHAGDFSTMQQTVLLAKTRRRHWRACVDAGSARLRSPRNECE